MDVSAPASSSLRTRPRWKRASLTDGPRLPPIVALAHQTTAASAVPPAASTRTASRSARSSGNGALLSAAISAASARPNTKPIVRPRLPLTAKVNASATKTATRLHANAPARATPSEPGGFRAPTKNAPGRRRTQAAAPARRSASPNPSAGSSRPKPRTAGAATASASQSLDEPRLPGGLERARPEVLDVAALLDLRGDDAPLERELLHGIALVRHGDDRALRAVAGDRGGRPTAVRRNEDGDRAEHLGDVAGGVRHCFPDGREGSVGRPRELVAGTEARLDRTCDPVHEGDVLHRVLADRR